MPKILSITLPGGTKIPLGSEPRPAALNIQLDGATPTELATDDAPNLVLTGELPQVLWGLPASLLLDGADSGLSVSAAALRAGSVIDISGLSSGQLVAQITNGGVTLTSPAVTLAEAVAAPDVPLSNTTLPEIIGTTEVGNTLSASGDEWAGSAPRTYSYQWTRDGVDISGATSNTYTLVAADKGAEIGVEVTADDGFTTVTASALAVAVETSAEPQYDLSSDEGTISNYDAAGDDVTFTLSGHSNTAANGDYAIPKTTIDAANGAPIHPADPTTTESPTNTFTATKGVILSPSNDPAEVVRGYLLGADTQLVPGLTYTFASGDEGNLLRFRETATNGAGESVRTVTAHEEVLFTESAVEFSSNTRVTYLTEPAPQDYMLRFTSLTYIQQFSGNTGIMELNGIPGRAIWSASTNRVQFTTLQRETGSTLGFTTAAAVSVGDRVNFLEEYDLVRDAYRIYTKFNSDAWVELTSGLLSDRDNGSTGGFVLGPALIGMNNPAGPLVYHRAALWFNDGSSPADISQAATRDSLVNSDGTIKDPAILNATIGLPEFDAYGPASAWNARTNEGSGAPFDAVIGTITDYAP